MTATCLACGALKLVPCLDLGTQPLANDFQEAPGDPEVAYPLAVVLCTDCKHLQLDYFINPDLMFKNYLYVSGTSETYRKYLDWFADHTGVRPGQKVLDIGCNDGTQLDMFKKRGALTWGVDPAENLHALSSKNHAVHLGYFGSSYDPGVTFDIVNAQNVFAHQRDPLDVLLNCKRLTGPGSRIYIQTSQADMVLNGEFDTIYHEHINFFNTFSFQKLAERAGLVLTDVRKTDIHGTSYMFVLTHGDPPSETVRDMISQEEARGLYRVETYERWAGACMAFRQRIRDRLEGRYIVAYGAAAKGNTLLNFVGVTPVCIVDDNPMKQGRFSPGRKSPVVPRSHLQDLPADQAITFVPLAWNLFVEIKSQILALRSYPLDEFVNLKDYFVSNEL
jgi:SAM-dependent methyltransferase